MRISMKALAAFPDGALEEGKTYDVERGRAKSLIDGGYAVAAEDDPAEKQERRTRKASTRKKADESTDNEGAGDGD